jgi:hypothetical protein
MTRNLLGWTLLAMLAAAGAASAEWVEDKPACPEEQVCTMSEGGEEPHHYGNSTDPCDACLADDSGVADTDGNATFGDCGGEVCAYDDPNRPVDNGTCMDGAGAGEACDDDVQYFGPGAADSGPPASDNPESVQEAAVRGLPALDLLAGAGVLGAVAILAARRGR